VVPGAGDAAEWIEPEWRSSAAALRTGPPTAEPSGVHFGSDGGAPRRMMSLGSRGVKAGAPVEPLA
jgi:hypothetical protein